MTRLSFSLFSNIHRYFTINSIERELSAWIWIVRYYWLMICLGLIALVALIIYLNPISFSKIYLANGQSGTVSNLTGQEYQSILAHKGLKIELVDTSGLNEGFHLLDSNQSSVNASFYPAGLDTFKDHPHIASLGSIQTAPIWLFYRGKEINVDDPFVYFSKKKISIGVNGTTNNRIFHLLANATLPPGDYSNHFLELRYLDAEKKLISGEIDAMFFIQDYESPITQRLLQDPSLNVYNFRLANSYAKNFPFLSTVSIPRGAIDLRTIRPEQDITLLATTINLLIDKDMHPSAQWGLIMAAKKVDENGKFFFTAPGKFPKYLDQSFPLSPIAERYYQAGIPTVFTYLPLRVATIFDQIWVPTLTIFISFSLFFGRLLQLRKFISEKILTHSIQQLRSIQFELEQTSSRHHVESILTRLADLKERMKSVWCEPSMAWGHIEFDFAVQQIAESAKEKLMNLEPNT